MGNSFRVKYQDKNGYINGQVDYITFTAWYHNGHHHREDGPAIIECGSIQGLWYVNGRLIYSYNHLQRMTNCTDDDILMFKLKYGEME